MTAVGNPTRFVATAAIRRAVAGRETEVLEAIGINWRAGRPHITCPYRDHADDNPSWRWDAKHAKGRCTCTQGDSVFDVVMKVERTDFNAAKVRVAELLDLRDLIRTKGGEGNPKRHQATDAASLLSAPADFRDDRLPVAYLARRLGVTVKDVPIPSTPMVGLKELGYYDPSAPGSKAKPKLVGAFPCAVFGTVAADGRTHAHRIYLARGGAGKADLGAGPDGRPRDPKKSARIIGDDNTSGRSVLWGNPERAPWIILCEGIETAAAVALAMSAEIAAGEVAVAAAISANGVETFQPYPVTRRITVAADRDEATKTKGKPASRRGERAAHAFGLKHHERIKVAVALPGAAGESIDWLDALRRDGIETVRSGLRAAALFVPTEAELDDLARGADRAAKPLPKSGRPAIPVMGGDLADATAAALRVLADEPNPLVAVYVRGTLLVRAVRMRDRLTADGLRRPMDALCLRAVDADWLALRLAEIADWYKVANLKMKPVDPPERVCRSVLAAAPWRGLPLLTGVIEAPTIRPDGSVLDCPGYDAATGLLFDPGDTYFPPIPNEPARADTEAALDALRQPLTTFPFVSEADRSVALSSVLTALVCRLLRAAPLFGYTAPKMASGKTLLATIPSYVACGRTPYLMSQAQDPTDERKRLLSALIECPAMLVIDNVERPLQSDAICTAITEPLFTDRLLGQSRTATVATNCLFAATGNNLQLAGDLTARALLCSLDPKCERPEEREFGIDLHQWVPEHRGEIAAAALTIVKAYLAAGAPKLDVPNFARFEEWQRLCRLPLVWLGLADPCETRRRIEDADPVRENLRALLAAWHQQFGNVRATIKAAIDAGARDLALQDAMEAIAGEKGGINTRRLGRFIAKHERRIEGGLCFERDGATGGVAYWRANGSGFSRFNGFSPSPSREKPKDTQKSCFLGDLRGTNPQNKRNPLPPGPVEVEL
jgi:phage/plasmid primase-like uncharacterized protein